MGKNNLIITALILGSFVSCKPNVTHDEYQDLEHKGVRNIQISQIAFDTIEIDAEATSLVGRWSLHKGKLYFSDYNLVAIQEYDLNGNYIKRHFNNGRGPNEWISPFVSTCFNDSRELVTIDRNWIINRFDSTDNIVNSPYPFLSDKEYTNSDWDQLLNNPDVNSFQMYQFNIDSKNLAMLDGKLVIPVITEHVKYNGYDVSSNADDFWCNSYNFMLIDINNKKTEYLFGHYPSIYSKLNIPAFSKYSFDVYDNKLLSSYAADSLIYVRDQKGDLMYSFGYNADGIDSDYPATTTFDKFSESFKEHKKEYGYFLNIKIANGYVFRSYKLKKEDGYGIQIYSNNDLIGQIETKEEVSIIGNCGDVFYGVLPVDLENDKFKIIKFKL